MINAVLAEKGRVVLGHWFAIRGNFTLDHGLQFLLILDLPLTSSIQVLQALHEEILAWLGQMGASSLAC